MLAPEISTDRGVAGADGPLPDVAGLVARSVTECVTGRAAAVVAGFVARFEAGLMADSLRGAVLLSGLRRPVAALGRGALADRCP
ncbi:hypothetical protein Scani_68720 [Streptomyces caniferus]|uniref:Uncharacterized protein n=1 Tax=Streptomyces caniferus TaxID=285557 RepID=A0A640SIE8_9ACTN|nr:hypothetical protein Scani_68720 [Streptomyces caniferus]